MGFNFARLLEAAHTVKYNEAVSLQLLGISLKQADKLACKVAPKSEELFSQFCLVSLAPFPFIS